MPYIPLKRRVDLELFTKHDTPKNAGELNYMFTVIAKTYLDENGLNYQNINDLMGALEGCKLELYRRIAIPYEDKKIDENGDV